MALGCSIVGPVDPKEVIRIAGKLYEIGVDMVHVPYRGGAAMIADLWDLDPEPYLGQLDHVTWVARFYEEVVLG